jgi:hypothetical protein
MAEMILDTSTHWRRRLAAAFALSILTGWGAYAGTYKVLTMISEPAPAAGVAPVKAVSPALPPAPAPVAPAPVAPAATPATPATATH